MEMSFNKEDLQEFNELLENGDFTHFLLSHTTSISVVGLILQTLIDKRDELEKIL